jgi:hypothetical protein
MINVLFSLAGSSKFFPETEYLFTKPLIDVCDKIMIEMLIDNFKSLKDINIILFMKRLNNFV